MHVDRRAFRTLEKLMYSPELGRVGRDDENWVGSELGRRAKLMYLVLRHNPIGSAVRRFQFQFHSLFPSVL